MLKQPSFPGLRDAMKKKVTRCGQFLAEIETVVPWGHLLARIEPHYPKAGRPPMARVYFLQNWYSLSDPMAEETLCDSEAMRRFAGIELGDDRIPDETTILNFSHLLERHGLTQAILADVNAHLADKGITLRSGTLVDATFFNAPSSTENKAGARDPEMSSTKKGNDWYFGMKAHIGVDANSGVPTASKHQPPSCTRARCGTNCCMARKPRSGPKRAMSAPSARQRSGPGKVWGVMRKAPKGGALHPLGERANRVIAMVRAKVEHPFRVIKR